jgi:hypothetical protein
LIKKLTIIIFCIILLSSFTVTPKNLSINDNTEEKSETLSDEDAPIWQNDDYWSYDIDTLEITVIQSGTQIVMDLTIDEFKPIVTSVTQSTYNLDLSGKVRGSFSFDDGSGSNFGGDLIYTKMSGDMQVRKTDLATMSGTIIIKSIAILRENPLSIPLPLPLTITVSMSHSSPRPFIDFPLYEGKIGTISEAPTNIEIKAESFILRILNIFIPEIPAEIIIPYEFEIPLIPYLIYQENISVQAGTFNTYNAELGLGLVGNSYYSPDAGNIVKLDINLDLPGQYTIKFSSELKKYNFQ